MSQFDAGNYPTVAPAAADLLLILQASSGLVKTSTVLGLANEAASLANLNLAVSVVSISTVLSTQQLLVVNSAGATNQTLPANALNTGRGYRIFNKGVGAVTVLPNGTDTIAGAASVVLAQYESVTLYSDGLGMWSQFS